ncbi:MAG: polysaccharide deacetylase [Vicingaceae bacterium]|nr:MAG: polysaccharide deacetylase [Vicingaceae bacterium]
MKYNYRILRYFFKNFIWHIPNHQNKIYLTFDDGPTPGVTEKVIEILNEFDVKATFFLLGKNAENYPQYFSLYKHFGHNTGNHTYSHPNGWFTKLSDYINDVEKSKNIIPGNLFRPPYGKLTLKQAKNLQANFKIVMWDVISYDFDTSITPNFCIKHVMKYARSGSILLFHDSRKSARNTLPALTEIIPRLLERGFQFDVI